MACCLSFFCKHAYIIDCKKQQDDILTAKMTGTKVHFFFFFLSLMFSFKYFCCAMPLWLFQPLINCFVQLPCFYVHFVKIMLIIDILKIYIHIYNLAHLTALTMMNYLYPHKRDCDEVSFLQHFLQPEAIMLIRVQLVCLYI